ncbi:MAG: hypothetical protein GW907_06830 [Betaproteobacteria bacterium]|nr:hypothetical protein [Betaproteobacteria bacterium]
MCALSRAGFNPPWPTEVGPKTRHSCRLGLSFLSLRTVRHELASGHLALLDVQSLPQIKRWYVTHLRSKTWSPATKVFKNFLLEQGGTPMNTWRQIGL